MGPPHPLRLALAGASGRTGRRVVRACVDAQDVRLVAALASPASEHLGADAGTLAGLPPLEVPLAAAPAAPFDVLLDLSVPAALPRWLEACAAGSAGLVLAATGHDPEALEALRAAAQALPILHAPNLALGVQRFAEAVQALARSAGPEVDVEIVEIHHRAKRDAPSGTARRLVELVRDARPGAPAPRVASLRMGGVVGEHQVHFAGPHETLTLTHRAHDRELFAAGALVAARWLCGRPPGLYGLADVLADT